MLLQMVYVEMSGSTPDTFRVKGADHTSLMLHASASLTTIVRLGGGARRPTCMHIQDNVQNMLLLPCIINVAVSLNPLLFSTVAGMMI